MTPAEILAALHRRGGSLVIQNNRLLVTPRGLLDDALRLEMKPWMRELRREAELMQRPLLRAALTEFPGSTVQGEEFLLDGDALDDHTPATLLKPCRSPRLHNDTFCASFTEKQLMGFLASQLALRTRERGCGDCLHVLAKLRFLRAMQKEEKIRERQKQAERANRAAMRESEERD